jgi:predicted CoA-binding protein
VARGTERGVISAEDVAIGRSVAPATLNGVHSAPGTIAELLTETRTWAVVGCSPDPRRDSHRVARLLQERGFRVIPVNPAVDELLGERCYPSVVDIPAEEGVEVVDIFRRADRAGRHVDEAIAIGARGVWLQLGVIDEAAAERAQSAGLRVVMDRCPAIELPRMAAVRRP